MSYLGPIIELIILVACIASFGIWIGILVFLGIHFAMVIVALFLLYAKENKIIR